VGGEVDGSRYLTAREAATALGVALPTLYAYVSRGLVRSEGGGEGRRARRYRAEDILRLKGRADQRRDPARAAEAALYLGAPVLESAITLIDGGHLYYRGRDAVALASSRPVEAVVTLLWVGDDDPPLPALVAADGRALAPPLRAARRALGGAPPLAVMQALLPVAAAGDPAAYDLRPTAVVATGARILWLLALAAVGRDDSNQGLAATLQGVWAPGDPRAAALIGAALTLCADHELTAATFVARCVASVNSTPYAVVQAGLAAAQGIDHGAQTRRVEAFLGEAGTPGGVRGAIERRLARGEALPGFGHALYPAGDPRGAALLDLAGAAYPDAPAVALARATVAEADALLGVAPSVEVGLVTVAATLGLPSDGALILFVLGRAIGWIAHAIEQYAAHAPIHPRARYVGVPPTGAP